MHPDLTSGCLKPAAAAALVLTRHADCLAACGAVMVIQVEAAIPMSTAMRPPVRRRAVFSSIRSPALPSAQNPP
jgi:hypothetical protein